MENIIKKIEEFGFTVNKEDDGYDISTCTPAGEDFHFFVRGNTEEKVVESIDQYANDFSVNNHVKESIYSAGAPEIPDLVDDAQWIQNTLLQMASSLCGIPEQEFSENNQEDDETETFLLNVIEEDADGNGTDVSVVIRISLSCEEPYIEVENKIISDIEAKLKKKKAEYIAAGMHFNTFDILNEVLEKSSFKFTYCSVPCIKF